MDKHFNNLIIAPESYKASCFSGAAFIMWIILSAIVFFILKSFIPLFREWYLVIPFFLLSFILFFYLSGKGEEETIKRIKEEKENARSDS